MIRGFKNRQLNTKIVNKMFDEIMRCLLCASQELVRDYQKEFITLKNDENVIRDEIYRNYLESNEFKQKNNCLFKFEKEIEENLQRKGKTPLGRVDLKVYNHDIFHNTDAYVIVECKRLDGLKRLNGEYVLNGIKRFTKEEPHYSSYYGKNIMFGFIVKEELNQNDIIENINLIQREHDDLNVRQEIKPCNNYFYSLYSTMNLEKDIGIYHIFYDFSSIIR